MIYLAGHPLRVPIFQYSMKYDACKADNTSTQHSILLHMYRTYLYPITRSTVGKYRVGTEFRKIHFFQAKDSTAVQCTRGVVLCPSRELARYRTTVPNIPEQKFPDRVSDPVGSGPFSPDPDPTLAM